MRRCCWMNAIRTSATRWLLPAASAAADAVTRAVTRVAGADLLASRPIVEPPLANDLLSRAIAMGTDAASAAAFASRHGTDRSRPAGARCPLACPFACGSAEGLSCTQAVSRASVPANVSPWVRPTGTGCACGPDQVRPEAAPLTDSPLAHAGVVFSCPLAGPLGSGLSPDLAVLHLLPPAAVPAKERRKSEQHGRGARGGEAP
jgi:hypothetical protein